MKFGPIKVSSEVVIMFVVMILSSVWDLIYAVGIGLVFASLIFMKRIGDMTSAKSNIKNLKPETVWSDEVSFPKNLKEEVFIKHINGPLFFGSTTNIQELAKQIPDTASLVIVRAKRMNYIDQSGLYALEDILVDLANKNIKIALVNITNQPRLMMERIDIIPNLVPENMIFDNFEDCTDWIKDNIDDIFK